ncbi:hypothetical protein LT85_1112 [Collimonas arenae]|uniref:Uncharacterized protein n=1 Tax=Collimonas arenae TaxID=279058 RepID=A0A0A1F944_9BURK|nr:hypothetical protein LT85_1112 [Collimonas arenae]
MQPPANVFDAGPARCRKTLLSRTHPANNANNTQIAIQFNAWPRRPVT